MAVHGTNRTNRADLMMSVPRGNPEVAFRRRQDRFDPGTDIRQYYFDVNQWRAAANNDAIFPRTAVWFDAEQKSYPRSAAAWQERYQGATNENGAKCAHKTQQETGNEPQEASKGCGSYRCRHGC